MICKNCKEEIAENAIYCPHCGFKTSFKIEKEAVARKENLPSADLWGKLVLLIGFLSVVLSLVPISKIVIIIGAIIGLIVLFFAIYQSIKKKHKLSTLTIIVAAIGFVSNISWFLFITYVL
jgi:DNA-directed RNA polymerase subunit RPC12/RpoP